MQSAPFSKAMIEVILYMEILEVTTKQPSTKKYDKNGSEDKTGKSKNKTKKFHSKNSKFKGRKTK